MQKLAAILLLIFVLAGLPGCAVTNLAGDVDPNAGFESLNSFYVTRQPNDRRGIEKLISEELNKRGKTASFGDDPTPPGPVDAVVTYIDKWMWDITNYMIELTIQFRNPETDYIIASGKSFRTSLARKSPEGMVEEVVTEIFNKSRSQE